ncbi:MAG: permease-like cell division protein FtsX [Bacteroidales bacterium]
MGQEEKYNRRRLRGAAITTVMSITLVLFVLGLLGLIVLHTRTLSDYIKENIGFSIIMDDNAREADILRLQKILDARPYVKSTRYITPEEAARDFSEALGEDFTRFLGYNPLLPTIEVRFKAHWANNDSLYVIRQDIEDYKGVREVWYQESLVDVINKNLRRIGIILLSFGILLLVISIALINNTIRLSVYAKRFLIRSMQLVGATHGFIARPFIWKGIFQGLVAALLANLLLVGVLFLARRELPDLIRLQDYRLYLSLFAMVLITGLIITWISTWLAVRKFIRIRADLLYY